MALYHDVHPRESEDAVVAAYRTSEISFSLVRPEGAGVFTITDYERRPLGSQNYCITLDSIMLSTVPTRGIRAIDYLLMKDREKETSRINQAYQLLFRHPRRPPS